MKHIESIKLYLELLEEARRIFNTDASWELKYNLIFSKTISMQMSKLFPLDYYDPDTSYEEDLRAWLMAAEEKADDLKKVLQ